MISQRNKELIISHPTGNNNIAILVLNMRRLISQFQQRKFPWNFRFFFDKRKENGLQVLDNCLQFTLRRLMEINCWLKFHSFLYFIPINQTNMQDSSNNNNNNQSFNESESLNDSNSPIENAVNEMDNRENSSNDVVSSMENNESTTENEDNPFSIFGSPSDTRNSRG